MAEASERPQWTKNIQMFLGGAVMDDPSYSEEGSDDDVLERIEEATNAILCSHYGHQIEDDQCLIPDHRYCIWCGKRATALGEELGDRAPSTP